MTGDRQTEIKLDESENSTERLSQIGSLTNKLHDDLEAAVKLTIEDISQDSTNEPNLALEQAIKSLTAVLEFLSDANFDIGLKQPLSKLLAALADADVGLRSDLLAPRRLSNRPPKPHLDNAAFGAASAIVTVMIQRKDARSAKTLDAASQSVGRVLERVGFDIGRLDTPPGVALKYFRARIQNRNPEDPARLIYEEVLNIPGIREFEDKALLGKLEILLNLKSQ